MPCSRERCDEGWRRTFTSSSRCICIRPLEESNFKFYLKCLFFQYFIYIYFPIGEKKQISDFLQAVTVFMFGFHDVICCHENEEERGRQEVKFKDTKDVVFFFVLEEL